MAEVIGIVDFLAKGKTFPVVDVRSPAEFENGHIPGAINIPIFSNEERAAVGINYKKNGKETAVIKGLEIVGPKLAAFVKQAKKIAPEKTILIHCWRGGMRSASMAWLFGTAGFKVFTLEGGYKNYRRHTRSLFDKAEKLIVLGGYTGSGKTNVLKEMEKMGAQFLDLEGIGNHKGSAFGAIGQDPQPSSEQFENNLGKKIAEFNLKETIWLEDESRQVGRCSIPDNLYARMRETKLLKIIVPKKIREKRLVEEYGCFPKELLERSILNIERRLGGLRTKQSLEALENNDLLKVAEITLEYYDKAYLHGNAKRDKEKVYELEIDSDDPKKTAKLVLEYSNSRF
ncbi:MAG: tRNA 2-selenouridine(34) synthase MnmH [Chlorobi bacterium]|nr:tRNA 2-selenouridine(34) synthase MnmH [Chlorobiota bacterium]